MTNSIYAKLGKKYASDKRLLKLSKAFKGTVGRKELKEFRELAPELFNVLYSKMCSIQLEDGEKIGGRFHLQFLYDFLYPKYLAECAECRKPTTWAEDKKRYREFCSTDCANSSIEVAKRRKQTGLERYGMEPNLHPSIQKKKIQAFQNNYGVDNPSQSKKIKNKKRDTCLAHYGVTHHTKAGVSSFHTNNPMKTEEGRAAHEKALLRNYGVSNPTLNTDIRNRQKKTCLRHYGVDNLFKDVSFIKASYLAALGVDHPMKSKAVKKRMRQRSVEKYGVPYPMQDPVVHARQVDSTKLCSEIRLKGKVHRIRGFEGIALKSIESTLKTVTTETKSIPRILYRYKGEQHYYFPDALVKTKSGAVRIVEVKSLYTLNTYKNNTAKFKAASSYAETNGMEFWVGVAFPNLAKVVWKKNPSSIRDVSVKCKKVLSLSRLN